MQVCGGDGASLVKGCLEMRVALIYVRAYTVQNKDVFWLAYLKVRTMCLAADYF